MYNTGIPGKGNFSEGKLIISASFGKRQRGGGGNPCTLSVFRKRGGGGNLQKEKTLTF